MCEIPFYGENCDLKSNLKYLMDNMHVMWQSYVVSVLFIVIFFVLACCQCIPWKCTNCKNVFNYRMHSFVDRGGANAKTYYYLQTVLMIFSSVTELCFYDLHKENIYLFVNFSIQLSLALVLNMITLKSRDFVLSFL